VFYVSVLAGVIAAIPARAEDSRAAASASFREAQAAFARRDFAAAAAAFEQTARTAPHPATWLNAAEAWELRGDWPRAAEACDRALEVAGSSEVHRREAERRLAIAVAHVGTLEVRGPGGFGARVDADAVQPVPLRKRLAVGRHRVVVVNLATGAEKPHEIVSAAGKVRVIDVPVEAPATPASDRATEPAATGSTKAPPTLSWALFASGGVLAAGAGALGYATLGAKDAYESDPTRDSLGDFKTLRTTTNVALGAAVIALLAGAAVWIWSPRREGPTAVVPIPRVSWKR
jgi:tetratricopeptide (TPR) repeat protein